MSLSKEHDLQNALSPSCIFRVIVNLILFIIIDFKQQLIGVVCINIKISNTRYMSYMCIYISQGTFIYKVAKDPMSHENSSRRFQMQSSVKSHL